MKHHFIKAGLLALLSSTALAEPAIWEVSDDDSRIWLFGSIHVLDESDNWQTETLIDAVNQADYVYYEVEPALLADQQKVQSLVMSHGINPTDQPLSSQLDQQSLALVKTSFEQQGVDFAEIEALQPWLAYLTLGMSYAMNEGLMPDSGIEMRIDPLVNNQRERSLESLEEQMLLLSTIPYQAQIQLLVEQARQIKEHPGMLDDFIRAWRNGDIETLDTLVREGMDKTTYDILLTERNHRWVKEIQAMLAGSQNTLIIVGAGHLIGDQSVVALLKAQGINVTRLQ